MADYPPTGALDGIRIVLVETTHPGNIGAVARAMKNMCLSDLVLVNPKLYPHAEATARASGAHDLLARTRVVETLDQALADCVLAIGTSARLRSVEWQQLDPRQCAARAIAESSRGRVAVVFGRESSGLTNAELDRCQYLVHIPANPDYSSLNIAQALQVISYELLMAAAERTLVEPVSNDETSVTADDMERLFEHLFRTMERVRFLDPRQAEMLQRRVRRLLFRAAPQRDELNILRGFLTAVEQCTTSPAGNDASSEGSTT